MEAEVSSEQSADLTPVVVLLTFDLSECLREKTELLPQQGGR